MSPQDAPEPFPEAFLQAVREALAALGWAARGWDDDAGTLAVTDAAGRDSTLGLDNIWRRCRDADPSLWVAGVRHHLEQLSRDTPDLPASLAEAADRLLPRLRKAGGEAEQQMWALPLGGDIQAHLVIDNPEAFTYVPASLVESSGEAGDAWLERAVANLRARTPAGYLRTLSEESGILCGDSDDAFDAARALLQGELVPDAAEVGCFCAVPTRDVLLALPLRRESFTKLHLLKRIAERAYSERPYPISDEVFWARGWEWQRVPILMQDGNVRIAPPEELAEIMFRLTMAGGDDVVGPETAE
jgi:hypothetical protein